LATDGAAAISEPAGGRPRRRRPDGLPGVAPAPLAAARQMAAMLVLVLALVLGGGPSQPLFTMVIELAALPLIVLAFGAMTAERVTGAIPALILVALIALTPLLQMIPLPPALWTALPGRETPVALLAAGAITPEAHPLTLEPDGTLRAGLALLPGIAIFLSTLGATLAERRRLATIIVGATIAGAMLGILQLANGADFDLYTTAHSANLIGFFANRNHEANMLLVGMLLAAGLAAGASPHRTAPRLIAGALMLLFSAAAVVTISRMGMLLLPIALAGSGILLLRRWGGGARPVIAVTVALIAIMLLASFVPVVRETAARFLLAADDARPDLWNTTWMAIHAFWPIGSGLGSFVPVFQLFEPLDQVRALYVNHAHDDYLEILLETGLWGLCLMVAGLAILVVRAVRPPAREGRAEHIAAACAVAILLLHSLADYPLRTATLATVFGFLAASLFPAPATPRRRRRNGADMSQNHTRTDADQRL
jgi:O-antigen ligase